MTTNTIERAAVRGTIIDHDRQWKAPVIPVVASLGEWACVWDGRFSWAARDGQVVLAVLDMGSSKPVLEVHLNHVEHGDLLLELLVNGEGTLAVLEQVDVPGTTPQWAPMTLDIEGLADAIREAGRQRREG